MKLNNISNLPPLTKEMIENFHERTNFHIGLVAKNINHLIEHYKNVNQKWSSDLINELLYRSKTHDASKFKDPEYYPYVWNTENHRCKNLGIDFEYPIGIKELVSQATKHHVLTNSHHPEYHQNDSSIIMPIVDVLEMVCDWTAMSEELGQGSSARNWADKNIGTRWNFSKHTIRIIYNTIDVLDNTKAELV